MPNITLALPKKLKEEMDSLPELNFSEIARQAIAQSVEDFKAFKEQQRKKQGFKEPVVYKKYGGDK